MGRVRKAGYLLRNEDGLLRKHWCVIRDRCFIIYPFLQKVQDLRSDTDGSPIFVLPVDSITARASVNPESDSSTKTCLKLYCAASGVNLTLYLDHEESLEKWLSAIKDESTTDTVVKQHLPLSAPLPPETGSDSLPLSKNVTLITPFSSRYGKETLSMRYLKTVDSGTKANYKHIGNAAAMKDQRSNPRQSLPNKLDPSSAADVDSPPATSSSVTQASNARQRSHPQGLNDSSLTSSSALSSGTGKARAPMKSVGFSRGLVQSFRRRQNGSKEDAAGSSLEVDDSPRNHGLITSSPVEAGVNSKNVAESLVPKRIKSSRILPGKFHTVGRKASSKRHTISDMSNLDAAILEHHRKNKDKVISNQSKTDLTKSNYSIAPLSNLDLNLKKRMKKKKSPLFSLHPEPIQRIGSETIEEQSTDEEEAKSNSPIAQDATSDSEMSSTNIPDDNFRSSKHLYHLRHQLGSTALNQSLPNLQQIQPRTKSKSPSVGKVRKQSAANGTYPSPQIIRNFGKRSKSEEERNLAFVQKERMHSTPDSSSIIKEGWMYRRKMVSWNKVWAVLSCDKCLRFFKSKPNELKSDQLLSLDLRCGCFIEDISQGKNYNSFWLYPSKAIGQEGLESSNSNEDAAAKFLWKPVQLMCKSNQEFVHWMKELVLLSSTISSNGKPWLTGSKPIEGEHNRAEISHSTYLTDSKKSPHIKKELNNNWKSSAAAEDDFDEISFSEDLKNAEDVFLYGGSEENINGLSLDAKKEKLERINSQEKADGATTMTLSRQRNSSENIASTVCLNGVEASRKVRFTNGSDAGEVKSSEETTVSRSLQNQTVKQRRTSTKATKAAAPRESDTIHSRKEMAGSAGAIVQINRSQNIAGANDDLARCDDPESEIQSKNKRGTFDFASNGTEICLESNASTADELEGKRSKPKNESFTCTNSAKMLTSSTSTINDLSKSANADKARVTSESSALKRDEDIFSQTPFSSRAIWSRVDSMKVTEEEKQFERKDRTSVDCDLETAVDSSQLPAVTERIKLFEGLDASLKNPKALEFTKDSEVFCEEREQTTSHDISPLHFTGTVDQNRTGSRSVVDNSHCESVGTFRGVVPLTEQFTLLPPLEPDGLRRAVSDSNLLEPSSGESYRMKTVKRAIPELTQIDFIEIYGAPKHLNITTNQYMDGRAIQEDKRKRINSIESDDSSVHVKELSDGCSAGSESSDSKASEDVNNRKIPVGRTNSESGTSEGSTGGRINWLFNISPKIRKSVKRPKEEKSSKGQIFQIPASQLKSASRRGFLERRNKKKQWEKFWCVFQDACIFFYNSPQSDVTRDAIVLRGYDVIADVRNTNCSKFTFRLEQQGVPSLYFCTDNFEEFLLWVATLEKEIRSTPRRKSSESLKYHREELDLTTETALEHQSSDGSVAPSPLLDRSLSQDRLESEIVEMQKHQLLKELAAQKEKILVEQRVLSRLYGQEVPAEIQTPSNSSKREEVIRKFDQVRDQEEARATKSMAFLNRRRNSAQIKLDHLTKELGPKSVKKRRDDHKHFAALELKQTELKEKLTQVDNEIFELQSNKESTMEKIRERQDLELLLTEQQEALDIMLKHSGDLPIIRNPHQSNDRKNALSSINETGLESDNASSTSSDSSGSDIKVLRTRLTFFEQKHSPPPTVFGNLNKDPHPLSILRSLSSDISFSDESISRSLSSDNLSKHSTPLSLSSSSYSLGDSMSVKQSSSAKKDVDPAVIASIADFEEFSAKALKKLKRKCHS